MLHKVILYFRTKVKKYYLDTGANSVFLDECAFSLYSSDNYTSREIQRIEAVQLKISMMEAAGCQHLGVVHHSEIADGANAGAARGCRSQPARSGMTRETHSHRNTSYTLNRKKIC